LPDSGSMRVAARSGPAIPNMQDLELQRGKGTPVFPLPTTS
jgi:hypothetical protein